MGILDRWRARDSGPAHPVGEGAAEPELDQVEEVSSRPLTGEEEARLEAARVRYSAWDIDPTDLASIAAAWDTAVHSEAEPTEAVTVVATAVGDHLVGTGYRWVVSHDPFGTDLAVEPPRRGVPVVVRTLVAVRWMKRETGWVVPVIGHLARAGRR